MSQYAIYVALLADEHILKSPRKFSLESARGCWKTVLWLGSSAILVLPSFNVSFNWSWQLVQIQLLLRRYLEQIIYNYFLGNAQLYLLME